jgi:RNA polymerase sigma factor (sigma-70 family)
MKTTLNFEEMFPPQKMDSVKEQALAEKIQKRDTKLEDYCNELALAHMHEALTYSRTVSQGKLADDELVSLCWKSLLGQARAFKPGFGRRFFAYAKPGLRGDLKNFWETQKTVKRSDSVSIDSLEWASRGSTRGSIPFSRGGFRKGKCGVHEGSDSDFDYDLETFTGQIQEPDFEGIFNRDLREVLDPLIESALTENERMVIRLAYEGGLSFQDIGTMLDTSRSAIQRVASDARKKLKTELKKLPGFANDL